MDKSLFWNYFTALIFISQYGYGEKIAGVCTDQHPYPNQPSKPEISEAFYVKVVCVLLESNQTMVVTEWYDFSNNKGRIHQQDSNEDGDIYYDYGNNEILELDRWAATCKVQTLDKNENTFMFGEKTDSTGRHHIMAPSGALHFGDAPELYLGKDFFVRGIMCDAWTSCQYSETLQATMNVTWYFSAKDEWDMQIGGKSSPIRAEVVGKIGDTLSSTDFHHIYDLFDFTNSIREDYFQLYPGDYCPGRVTYKPFPGLPQVFSVTGEILDLDTGKVETVEEHYDQIRKLNVYNYSPANQLGSLTGGMQRTEVNDFNAGYAYMVDRQRGACTIGQVTEGNFAFVDPTGTGTRVRQQTPAEFFSANNVTWEYGGQKTVRGILCDTWVGQSNHTKGREGKTFTIEWAFATTDYTDWNPVYTVAQIPVSMRMWPLDANGDGGTGYQYNALAFSPSQPMVGDLDISPCFTGVQRVNVRFNLAGTYQQAVFNNVQMFKTALADSGQDFLGISILQISNIKVYRDQDIIAISLDLLDKPSFPGDAVNGLATNSLSAAMSLLYDEEYVEKDFQISVAVGENTVTMKPMSGSLRFLYSNGTCVGCGTSTTSPPGQATSPPGQATRPPSQPTGLPGQATTPTPYHGHGSRPASTPSLAPNHVTSKTGNPKSWQGGSSGYSSGSLAGVGLGLLLVGGLGGSAGGYFVFRK